VAIFLCYLKLIRKLDSKIFQNKKINFIVAMIAWAMVFWLSLAPAPALLAQDAEPASVAAPVVTAPLETPAAESPSEAPASVDIPSNPAVIESAPVPSKETFINNKKETPEPTGSKAETTEPEISSGPARETQDRENAISTEPENKEERTDPDVKSPEVDSEPDNSGTQTEETEANEQIDAASSEEKIVDNIQEVDTETEKVKILPGGFKTLPEGALSAWKNPQAAFMQDLTETFGTNGFDQNNSAVLDLGVNDEQTITFSGFGSGTENSNREIQNLQLRLSMAALAKDAGDSEIVIEYKTGDDWLKAGTISLSEEISNEKNGGFFLFPLPLPKDGAELENSSLRFRYDPKEGISGNVFIDAVWLEASYTVLPSQKELADAMRKKIIEKFFNKDENPTFIFSNLESKKNFLQKLFSWVKGEKKEIKATIVNPREEESSDGITIDGQVVKILNVNNRQFRPGKYTIKVKVKEGDFEEEQNQQFEWGVLTVNTDKSTYKAGDTSQISLGVLDKYGHTVCDSEIILLVTDPDGNISYPEAIPSGDCDRDNITDKPDYAATYSTTTSGKYSIGVIATTPDGAQEISDSFEVLDSVAFDVQRTGPTRINPTASYQMKFRIAANEDYAGTITDYVPADFNILEPYGDDNSTTTATTEGNLKKISWEVDMKSGQIYDFAYTFKAPEVSPYIFLIGPLQIGDFYETRQWQIASDATYTSSGGGDWNTNSTWGGGGHPIAGDIANIAGHAITVNATDAAATTVTFTVSGGSISVGSGRQLAISGTMTLKSFITGNSAATLSGSGQISAKNLFVGDTALTACGTTATYTTKMTSTITTLNVTGGTGSYLEINSYYFKGGGKTCRNNGSFLQNTGNVTIEKFIRFSPAASATNPEYTMVDAGGSMNGTLSLGNSLVGTGTLTVDTAGCDTTVIYPTSAPESMVYHNLTLSMVNSMFGASLNTINGNLTLAATGTSEVNTNGNLTIGGNLIINSSNTFTVGSTYTLSVGGTSTIDGGLAITSTSGAKTFTGLVTVNNGGTWNNSGNCPVTFAGGLTNAGTFTAGTGIQTFTTNNQTITCTAAISIPSMTITTFKAIHACSETYPLTVSTALIGTGELESAVDSYVKIGGTSTVTTWDNATATPNTVEYYGTGTQTIRGLTYWHLKYTGSSTGTLSTAVTVNGDMTISSGTVATANYVVYWGGSFSNSGTFTAGSSLIYIQGTSASPTIAGFTTGNTINFTRTASTATFTGNVSAATLTMNGGGGTLDLGAGLTHTLSGNVTLTAGTLEGGSSNLSLSGTWSGASTFTAETGTITFAGTGAQTIPAINFYNLATTGARAANSITLGNTANWSANGNSTTVSGTGSPAIVALSATRVAFIDNSHAELRTYELGASGWTQVGNSLAINNTNVPALAALSATRVAFIDSYNDQLRTYDFNGTDWSMTGSGLSISDCGVPALATLSATRVAFIDAFNHLLKTYTFNGSTWSQVGNSFSISSITQPSLAALSATRVAYIDSSNDQLQTYDFASDTTWSQTGNGLAITLTGYSALAKLSATRVAFIDDSNDQLRAYDFDNTDWTLNGSAIAVSTTGTPALAALSDTRVAFIDSTNIQLRTYEFESKIGVAGSFAPAATFTSGGYITTGSTVEYNGSTPWPYHKQVTITGQSGAGTDYQVLLNVGESSGATGEDFDLASHATNFPNDIMFTATDGITVLPYYVEETTGTTPNRLSKIWVKVSANLDTNQNIIIYYGKTGATSQSSGDNTFRFFDNFDDSAINAGKWVTANCATYCSIAEASGYLRMAVTTYSASKLYVQASSVSKLTYPMTIQHVARVGTNNIHTCVGTGIDQGCTYDVCALTTCQGIRSDATFAVPDFTVVPTNVATQRIAASTWVKHEEKLASGASNSNIGGTDYSNTASISTADDYLKLNVRKWDTRSVTLDFDYIFIRKYAATEPAYNTSGSEETDATLTQIVEDSFTYNNLSVKPGLNNAIAILSAGTLTVQGNMVVGNGSNTGVSVTAAAADPNITVAGSFTVNPSTTFTGSDNTSATLNIDGALTIAGTFAAPAGTSATTFTLGGSFINNGTYTHNSGRVTLDGNAGANNQTLSGTTTPTTFYQFFITAGGTRTVYFSDNNHYAIADNGTFNLAGTSSFGLTVTRASTVAAWYLDVSSTNTTVSVLYTTAAWSNASGGKEINATGGTNTDGENTVNWVFTISNYPPTWSAHPHEDPTSDSATPTSVGSNLVIKATAADTEDNQYYLAICKTNAITANSDAAPTCTGGVWAISAATDADAEATASYTASSTDTGESYAWYAFACDKTASQYGCTAMDNDGTSGNNGTPFSVNHRPTFTTVANDGPKNPGAADLTITAESWGDSDTASAQDTGSLYVCKSNDFSSASSTCGAAGTWCSETAIAPPAGAWLSDYTHRVKVPVNYTTAGAQTDYTMTLNIVKGTGTNSAGTIYLNNNALNWPVDIKFTSSDGTTQLQYYRVEYDSTDGTWDVELPYIGPSGSTDFYVYYGKSDAAYTGSAYAAYIWGDSFETGDFNWYSMWWPIGGAWSVQTSVKQDGSYAALGSPATLGRGLEKMVQYSNSIAVKMWVRTNQIANYMMQPASMETTEARDRNIWPLAMLNGNFMYWNGIATVNLPTPKTFSVDTWYKVEFAIDLVSNPKKIRWLYVVDGDAGSADLKNDFNEVPTQINRIYNMSAANGGPSFYIDQMAVRKYAYPEPTWATPEAEVAGGATLSCKLTISNPQAHGNVAYYAYLVDSHGLLSEGQSGVQNTFGVNDMLPAVSGTPTLNNTAAIDLTGEKTTTDIYVRGVVTDDNGCADPNASTTADTWQTTLTTRTGCNTADEANGNKCYYHATCAYDATVDLCEGGNDKTAGFKCTVPFQYYANPTDANTPWAGDNWTATFIPGDDQGENILAEVNTAPQEMNSFLSLGFATDYDAVSFGNMDPGTSTNPLIESMRVEATGNCSANTNLYGTAMTGPGTDIPVANQRYGLGATPPAWGDGTELAATSTLASLNICKSGYTATPEWKPIWWGINVPAGQAGGDYTGTNYVVAVKKSWATPGDWCE